MKEYIVICNIDTEEIMGEIIEPSETMEQDIRQLMNERLSGYGVEVLSVTEKR